MATGGGATGGNTGEEEVKEVVLVGATLKVNGNNGTELSRTKAKSRGSEES